MEGPKAHCLQQVRRGDPGTDSNDGGGTFAMWVIAICQQERKHTPDIGVLSNKHLDWQTPNKATRFSPKFLVAASDPRRCLFMGLV